MDGCTKESPYFREGWMSIQITIGFIKQNLKSITMINLKLDKKLKL